MTPRKWTAADVTLEDVDSLIDHLDEDSGYMRHKEDVAACWNRLEEKRAAFEGGSIHLLRELEALERNRECLVERHGLPGYRLRFPQMDDSIAEIKSRISGSDSGKSERQDALLSTDERQDPFFDADHLAEVGDYMEERARKKLLAQALEALRACRLHLRHDKMCSAKISGGIYPCDCGAADMVLKNAKVIAELEKEVEQ